MFLFELSFRSYLFLDISSRLCGSSSTGIGFHKATVDISLQFDIEVLLGFINLLSERMCNISYFENRSSNIYDKTFHENN